MLKPWGTIQLVVTDLDNTLYDWVTSFVPAFYRMAEVAATLLGADLEDLLDQLRAVHQRHGSSEHPFALLETATVQRVLSGRSIEEQKHFLDPAFHAFNSERNKSLRLYDGVLNTLLDLCERGVAVVAHTDARMLNSLFRLVKLGLVGPINRLYAPMHVCEDMNAGHLRYDLPANFVRLLPSEDRKPNPKTLKDICLEYGASPAKTLYIGDSISRDVYMARRAGAVSAWARYGTIFEPMLWDKLVRVTHWTEEDVERERQLKREAAQVRPDVQLDSFAEIFQHFEFSCSGAQSAAEESGRSSRAANRLGS